MVGLNFLVLGHFFYLTRGYPPSTKASCTTWIIAASLRLSSVKEWDVVALTHLRFHEKRGDSAYEVGSHSDNHYEFLYAHVSPLHTASLRQLP